ncbi:MAG: hypothetical protein QOF63_171 [Thermoanaerobaculia bacterium]|jgi:hypothetical protein|nr:hypothetical protein [Thermoanaerobaculia bacterium]
MARSRNTSFTLLAVIVPLTVYLLFNPQRSQATTIIKSKSNIANNREAGPNQNSGPGTVVLLCQSCTFVGLPDEGHLVLMDSVTGDIWAYSDAAVVGDADPLYVGTMTALGKRIAKKTLPPKPQ